MKRVFTILMLFALTAAVTSCENEASNNLTSDAPVEVLSLESDIVDPNGAAVATGTVTGQLDGVSYTFSDVLTAKGYAALATVTDQTATQPEDPDEPKITVESMRYDGFPFSAKYGSITMSFSSFYNDGANYGLESDLFGGFFVSKSYTTSKNSDYAARFSALADSEANGTFLSGCDMSGTGYTSGINNPSPTISFSEATYLRSFKTALSPLVAAHELVIADDATSSDDVCLRISGYLGVDADGADNKVTQTDVVLLDWEGVIEFDDWYEVTLLWHTPVDKVVFTVVRDDTTCPKYFAIDDLGFSTESYWAGY